MATNELLEEGLVVRRDSQQTALVQIILNIARTLKNNTIIYTPRQKKAIHTFLVEALAGDRDFSKSDIGRKLSLALPLKS